MPTKQKIIDCAIRLFNESGFNNITMQRIAAEVGMSSGNLAYHFKNKDALMESIYKQLADELRKVMAAFRVLPDFKNFNHQIAKFFQFQGKYQFFYLDTLEIVRAYPEIAREYQKYIVRQIENIRAMLDYNVGTGNLIQQPDRAIYDRVALNIWLIATHWSIHQLIRGKDHRNLALFADAIWGFIMPYFTEQGVEAFKKLNSQILLSEC